MGDTLQRDSFDGSASRTRVKMAGAIVADESESAAKLSRFAPTTASGSARRGRPGTYIALLIVTVLSALCYSQRMDGVFSCRGDAHTGNDYLAYCQATRYGDYDYGAFWFGLEPQASTAAENADVLFLGNSRLQYGLSTDVTSQWFESVKARYFLLGFAYFGNAAFDGPLLGRLHSKARAYVIDVDRFFTDSLTEPAELVLKDSTARGRYGEKRFWQRADQFLCSRVGTLCGDRAAIFRSRADGSWRSVGGHFYGSVVSYQNSVDSSLLKRYVQHGRDFVARLPVKRECIVLTIIPTSDQSIRTEAGTARAIADSLGLQYVAPQPAGLKTFDSSHLDRASAERWSSEFITAAGPILRRCLI